MASRPNTSDIGHALSQPTNVWKLYHAAKLAALTTTDPTTRDALSGLLCELEFGTVREFADELTTEDAEAGIAAIVHGHTT